MKESIVNCLTCKTSSVCFKKLFTSQLEFINLNKKQVHYRKGENIIKQGAFAPYVLYIANGLVKTYLEGAANKDVNIGIYTTSEFMGMSAISGEHDYNYSAQALKDSTICLIEKTSYNKLLSENGGFALEVIKGFCRKEKKLFHKIDSLGNKQMHGRLADVLLYLCDEEFEEFDITQYLSRKDIADFACISMESSVRIMNEFKHENLIEVQGRRIKILNRDTLLSISDRG